MTRIERVVKKIASMPKDATFSQSTVGADSNNFARLSKKGLIVKGPNVGTWKRANPDGNFYKAWKDSRGKGATRGPRAQNMMAMAKRLPQGQDGGPAFRIVPYQDNQLLIIVGRRTFLATEVALTPRGGLR